MYGVAFNFQSPICQGHNVQIYVYLNNEIQQLCSVNRHISQKKEFYKCLVKLFAL